MNSAVEINGTHLSATSQSLMQLFTMNIPSGGNINNKKYIASMVPRFFCHTCRCGRCPSATKGEGTSTELEKQKGNGESERAVASYSVLC